ncbi:MAG: hypothetical protein JRD68_09715 [Deltaproteobacteria bacterium]|nr:hypothetical protein [Deltaproteobacteria bacterium]
MKTLKERTKWAINYVIDKEKLSNPKMGKKLGVSKDTVGAYRNMKAEPKVSFILVFCKEYEFDDQWFTKGIGEPYPGARQEFPEVCGETVYNKDRVGAEYPVEAPKKLYVRSSENDYNAGPFGKASEGLREIFDSRDPVLIPAIEANIRAFQLSVRRDRQIQQQGAEIETLKKRVAALEEKLNFDPQGTPESKQSTGT